MNKVNINFTPTQEEIQEYLAYKSEKDVICYKMEWGGYILGA